MAAEERVTSLFSEDFWTSLFFTLWLAFFLFLIGVVIYVGVTG